MDYHMNTLEKDCSLYGVFQQIINDLKVRFPILFDIYLVVYSNIYLYV